MKMNIRRGEQINNCKNKLRICLFLPMEIHIKEIVMKVGVSTNKK